MSKGDYWNHRLVRVRDGDDSLLMLCEVYYKDGKPWMRNDGARIMGESPDAVARALDMMRRALNEPVLHDEDFPNGRS